MTTSYIFLCSVGLPFSVVQGPTFSYVDPTVSLLLVSVFACGSLHLVLHFSLGQINANSMFLITAVSCSDILLQIWGTFLELGPSSPLFLCCTQNTPNTMISVQWPVPPHLCTCCFPFHHFHPLLLHLHIPKSHSTFEAQLKSPLLQEWFPHFSYLIGSLSSYLCTGTISLLHDQLLEEKTWINSSFFPQRIKSLV